MARLLAAVCFGTLLPGALGAWLNGQEEVDPAAIEAEKEAVERENELRAMSEALANNNSCFKADASYVPLDMLGSTLTQEDNATMCQVRCNTTDGCSKWSFHEGLSQCHITDDSAMLASGVVGFTAGPKVCRIQDCTTDQTTYFPWLEPAGFYANFSRVEALLSCQKLCLSVADCAHFVLKIPSQACHLADWRANKYRMYGSVTGPPTCKGKKAIALVRLVEDLPSSERLETVLLPGRRSGGAFALSGALVGVASFAALGFAASRARRRGRTASFDRAPQQSLEEKLSADGVEEEAACLAAAA